MTAEEQDCPRRFRADLARTLQQYAITDRGAEARVPLSKSTVSRLHTEGDTLPNWQHVELVLAAFDTVPESVIENFRCRHIALTAAATESAEPEADHLGKAADTRRPWLSRRTWPWVGVALLVLAVVIAAITLISRSGGSTTSEPSVVITVRNEVAIGASKLVPDPSGPAYLSTETRPHCAANDCKVPNSDLEPGQELIATCETHSVAPMRNYNESDPDPQAEHNPRRVTSTLWYRARTQDGKYTGMISAIYLDPADQHGRGLPTCPA